MIHINMLFGNVLLRTGGKQMSKPRVQEEGSCFTICDGLDQRFSHFVEQGDFF